MVKTLRRAALVAFLCLPVIAFLGRPVNQGCPPEPGPVYTPCDPLHVSPTWVGPAFLTALGIAVLFLLLAAVANRPPEEDRP